MSLSVLLCQNLTNTYEIQKYRYQNTQHTKSYYDYLMTLYVHSVLLWETCILKIYFVTQKHTSSIMSTNKSLYSSGHGSAFLPSQHLRCRGRQISISLRPIQSKRKFQKSKVYMVRPCLIVEKKLIVCLHSGWKRAIKYFY